MEGQISELFGGYPFKTFESHAPVTTSQGHWLRRGRQRRAVAKALNKPLTQVELWDLARKDAPNIQLRDVWAILNDYKERGLAYCLNPTVTIGKLHFWTTAGCNVVKRTFEKVIAQVPAGIDWERYSFVARAPLRREVLAELRKDLGRPPFRTATQIRKNLRDRYPVGVNSILRAVRELLDRGLIEQQVIDGRKVYGLSPAGLLIHNALNSERCERSP
jgi:Fe2+ or Zn2+ uptake regulation protein